MVEIQFGAAASVDREHVDRSGAAIRQRFSKAMDFWSAVMVSGSIVIWMITAQNQQLRMFERRRLLLAVVFLWALTWPLGVHAQDLPLKALEDGAEDQAEGPSDAQTPVLPQFGAMPTLKSAKLDSRLATLARAAAVDGIDAAIAEGRAHGLDFSGANVRVVVVSDPAYDASTVETTLMSIGGVVEARYENLVQALIPVASLNALEALPQVSWVRPPAAAFQSN